MSILIPFCCLLGLRLSATVAIDVVNEIEKKAGNERSIEISGKSEVKDVKFYLFTKRNIPAGSEPFWLNNPLSITSIFTDFYSQNKTKILVPDWKDLKHNFSKELKFAYLYDHHYNIIITEWDEAVGVNISKKKLKKKIPRVAEQLGNFIKRLCLEFHLDPKDLHVIGYGLGAHIAGTSSRYLSIGKIGRVTGLDPIESGFDYKHQEKRISTESGLFVDIIHTSGRNIGKTHQIGHADFFPNSGRWPQDGCWIDLLGYCSHERAYLYYSESIIHPYSFKSTPCRDWETFKDDKCGANAYDKVYMGEFTPKEAKGTYYLYTNSRRPYTKH